MEPTDVTRLHLLGSPQLVCGAHRHSLPDSLPGYLVAYLALRADWVAREQLATLFWPDAAADEAQHNLRVNLNRLRPQLRAWGIEDTLVAERRRLRLLLSTDVALLQRAASDGSWVAAARAARGPFMDGVTFRAFPVLGEWARSERDALMRRWREAILAAAPPLAPAETLELAQAYLRHDALDEDIVRVQLGALAALGRTDDARHAHAAYRTHLRAEIGVEPDPALSALLSAAAGSGMSAPVAAGGDTMVGREAELAMVAERIAAHALVTLVGVGGVGKTRVASAAAQALAARFSAGVLWIGAHELNGPSAFPRHIADRLQLPAGGGPDPTSALHERLGASALLVILDNAESLLGERAALLHVVESLLERVPALKILVTSREPLKCKHEAVIVTEGLALPAAGAAPLESPAVQLFVAQARRVQPLFDPRPVQEQLAQIARLTGGLPLALRLAAAWIRVLGVADIVAELRRGLELLEGDEAHGGVVRSIGRSWERLDDREHAALAGLAVFESAFSADDAREVAQTSLAALAALVDRSLLMRQQAGDRTRFELHPLVRHFVLERLRADPGRERAIMRAHARHFGRVLAIQGEAIRTARAEALRVTGTVLADALAAWRHALATGDVDFIVPAARMLMVYFEDKGLLREGEALFREAEPVFDPAAEREVAACAAIGRARAAMLYRMGDNDEAQRVAERALDFARSVGHVGTVKACLNIVGIACWKQGRLATARQAIAEAFALAQQDGDQMGEAVFAGNLALIDRARGDYAGAERGFRAALALDRAIGHWATSINMMNSLGDLLRQLGRLDESQVHLEEALRLADEHGMTRERPHLLINLALVHRDAGRVERAWFFADLALTEVRQIGDRVIECATQVVRAGLALRQHETVAAATHLAAGLHLARATGDAASLLEALVVYGELLLERRVAQHALEIWHALRRCRESDRVVLDQIDAHLRALGASAQQPPGTDPVDLVALTEQALRDLDAIASEAQSAAAD
jgi:predicted ATPase/DNA-binding SARP family transcriptional activator/Tfp pilus assembly protein PilF